MKNIFIFFAFAIFAILTACDPSSATINYSLPAPVTVEVFSQNHYSTMDGGYEQIGTVTETRYSQNYAESNDTITLTRKFLYDASKGYLKKSHPAELALRLPELKLTAANLKILNIEGNENFSEVVSKVSIPDRWKKQITNFTRQVDLDRADKLRWEITHLLTGEIPLKSDITLLLTERGQLPLANVQVDSVRTQGLHKINGRECLEYAVFLREKEPFPYFIWEQHISITTGGKQFKEYAPQNANYQNRWEVAIDTQNGVPCLEREYKNGINEMKNLSTGDSITFESLISKTRLYTIR
ncbi:hypothetical protein AGMMS49938_04820 [Fibrobacterales bacterium]|nr:hypothetical protein AGMMS49938_04820 [Fibrobacterales bacterium]